MLQYGQLAQEIVSQSGRLLVGAGFSDASRLTIPPQLDGMTRLALSLVRKSPPIKDVLGHVSPALLGPAARILTAGRLLEQNECALAINLLNTVTPHVIPRQCKRGYPVLLARLGLIDQAQRAADEIYQRDSHIKDLNVPIAEQVLFPAGDYQGVLQSYLTDQKNGRLSDVSKIGLAKAYAFNDRWDEATSVLENAYAGDPGLQDGYTSIGWSLFRPQWRFHEARQWMEKDQSRGRASENGALQYAQCLAATNQFDNAMAIVDDLYRQNPRINNGYARVGYMGRLSGNLERASSLFDMEIESGRLVNDAYLWQAQMSLGNAEYEKAQRLISTYALPVDRVVGEVHMLHVNGKIPVLDYRRLCEFLQHNVDINKASPSSDRLLIAFNSLLGDVDGVRHRIDRARHHGEEYVLTRLHHVFWSVITQQDCADHLTDVDPAVFCRGKNAGISLLSALCFALCGHQDQCCHMLKHLHVNQPFYFVRKDVTAINDLMWLGILARYFGHQDASRQCLSYAAQYAPGWKGLETVIGRCLQGNEDAGQCHMTWPEFLLPALRSVEEGAEL